MYGLHYKMIEKYGKDNYDNCHICDIFKQYYLIKMDIHLPRVTSTMKFNLFTIESFIKKIL